MKVMMMMMMMMKRRSLCTAVTAAVTRWERVKRSRAGAWCHILASDYTEACREVAVSFVWQRPLSALTCLGLMGGAWACAATNPNQDSLRDTLLRSSNRLGLLSPRTRSVASQGHVQSLTRLHNEGRLRHLGLGVASLAWRADHGPVICLYEAAGCVDLASPRWPWELPGRVLDVGLAGRWWVLDAKMKDWDVNDEEFQSLPAHMRTGGGAALPPSVREVERNESLHKASSGCLWR